MLFLVFYMVQVKLILYTISDLSKFSIVQKCRALCMNVKHMQEMLMFMSNWGNKTIMNTGINFHSTMPVLLKCRYCEYEITSEGIKNV
jgi:aspartate carbamoyltransferase regulatory subunit